MDPNNDNDLSDHLDVINMSLGSSFGSRDAAPRRSPRTTPPLAGVIVVASAGNSGDTYFITGVARRRRAAAISVGGVVRRSGLGALVASRQYARRRSPATTPRGIGDIRRDRRRPAASTGNVVLRRSIRPTARVR